MHAMRSRSCAVLLCLVTWSAARGSEAPASAPDVPASKTRLGVSAGVGYGYDGAGVQLEVVHGHFGASLGVGTGNFVRTAFYPSNSEVDLRSVAVSVRTFAGDGGGFMLAFSAMATLSRATGEYVPADATRNQLLHLTLLAGYRWAHEHFFGQAAAGPVVNYEFSWMYVDEPGSAQPKKRWNTGAFNAPGEFVPWFPAVEVGFGYLF